MRTFEELRGKEGDGQVVAEGKLTKSSKAVLILRLNGQLRKIEDPKIRQALKTLSYLILIQQSND